MMDFKPQTLRFVMLAMMDTVKKWDEAEEDEKEWLINPDAPLVIQTGDHGYWVLGVGGDPDVDGFVIQSMPDKICTWKNGEFKKLGRNK